MDRTKSVQHATTIFERTFAAMHAHLNLASYADLFQTLVVLLGMTPSRRARGAACGPAAAGG